MEDSLKSRLALAEYLVKPRDGRGGKAKWEASDRGKRMRVGLVAGLMILVMAGTVRGEEWVWWEGEDAADTNFSNESWLRGDALPKREGLSGREWLNNDGARSGPELFARYRVTVDREDTYQFWARKFWKHGSFRWRFDKGPWHTCGTDIGLADTFVFRKHVCANWVHLGEVPLGKGTHNFELRLLAGQGEKALACFDAFVLIDGTFTPRGKLKPGEKSGLSEQGWWAFEPGDDPFKPSPVDLAHLNEEEAGQSGFVRREGDAFALGSGETVRFWGVNAGPDVVRLDRRSIDLLARKLAKAGVNIVRFHGPVYDRAADDPATVDADFLDRLHYFVAATKKEGIYTKLSFYFPLWFSVKPGYGIAGYEGLKDPKPFAILTFNPRMQAIYRSWARGLLTTENPYTGAPLAEETAVAVIEIVNEDSYFFWTMQEKTVPPAQRRLLGGLFGEWLVKRYGSIEGAFGVWGEGARHKDDRVAETVVAIEGVWNLTGRGHGQGAHRRRRSDQLRFLAEHQKAFYESIVRTFRDDLGVKQLISCSNWKTADPAVLGPIERYTYTAGDVIDRHGYFGGEHKGPRASYSVSKGDTYADRAGVREPAALPIQAIQVVDFPQITSEIGWPNPNRFKAEFPFLTAAYASLQGIDAVFFFALHGAGWERSVNKFPLAVPTILGQFPAFALAYRRGDVATAQPVVRERLNLEALYDFKGAAVVETGALDALRRADTPGDATPQPDDKRRIDPLAFYVGPVVRRFDSEKSDVSSIDLSRYVDRAGGVVRSATGELRWDYREGRVTLDSPRSQGAAGFLAKAGRIELADVAIQSENEFGCVVAVSLDGEALASSRRILIQAMTEERPYGWRTEGRRIADLGTGPMNVRNIRATVSLRRGAGSATALDANGYARDRIDVRRKGAYAEVVLPADAIWTVISFP